MSATTANDLRRFLATADVALSVRCAMTGIESTFSNVDTAICGYARIVGAIGFENDGMSRSLRSRCYKWLVDRTIEDC